MNEILGSLNKVLTGENKPTVNVEIDINSIYKSAAILFFAGVLFVMFFKLIKRY